MARVYPNHDFERLIAGESAPIQEVARAAFYDHYTPRPQGRVPHEDVPRILRVVEEYIDEENVHERLPFLESLFLEIVTSIDPKPGDDIVAEARERLTEVLTSTTPAQIQSGDPLPDPRRMNAVNEITIAYLMAYPDDE